ncbi:tRNA-uridine aminocarboxypropyltransferase [Sulfurovum sp. TSL1]|uniref:tRNA-uridine aminocarboxypropyltransferase n=1 Tax=Sulfurovum sp. TSL1 TaxID=2826994 RepID=UPI001CC4D1EF|nr:tRNA-uridine aminocarboxypropyltransferase [Sulfurovum sp. TSL1]
MKTTNRPVCYNCYRPQTSCMCRYITPIETNTRFVILMHPKEFRKTKNGTGHFTNLSLKHCEIHVGIDFTKHAAINTIINDPSNICYTLYPHENSINLNEEPIGEKQKNTVIFLIDSTWPCSRAILTASPNIDALPKISFTHTEVSKFTFKEQPEAYCLSTMESALCVLKRLNSHQIEAIERQKLDRFLLPFEKMVAYQLSCV